MKLITVNLHMLILSTIYSSFLIKIRPGINKYSRLSNIDSHINKYNNNNHHHIKKLMEDLNLPLNKTCNFINKYKFSNFINKTESFITPQISEKTTNFRTESFPISINKLKEKTFINNSNTFHTDQFTFNMSKPMSFNEINVNNSFSQLLIHSQKFMNSYKQKIN